MASYSAGDVNRGPIVLGITLSTVILGILAVGTRLLIRLRITKVFGWDDGLIVAALILAITSTSFNILMVKEGAGQHQKYLSGPQIENVIKWNTAYELFNIPCVCLVKLSILLFILRIDNSRRLRVIVWTVIGVLILTNLATELAIAFQCIPLNALWDEKVEGKCIGGVAIGRVGYGQGAISVLTDLFCSFLPAYILWNVQIKLSTKITICCLTALGLGATASNIARNVYFGALDSHDFTYDIWVLFICALLEQNIGIIASCIVTFRPLFRMFGNGSRRSGAADTKKSGTTGQTFNVSSMMKHSRSGYGSLIELQPAGVGNDLEARRHCESFITSGGQTESLESRIDGFGELPAIEVLETCYPSRLEQGKGIIRTTTFSMSSRPSR